MSSRNYGDREYDLLAKLKYENKKLKKRISGLRKQLDRIDLDRYHNLKGMIEKHDREDHEVQLAESEMKLRRIWECWKCRDGILRYIPLSRRDGEYYLRKCDNCENRTKVKKLTTTVKRGPQ